MNDDEPAFHVRYVKDATLDNGHGYWEDYDVAKKRWTRICDECMEKVCRSSTSFCTYHHQQRQKKAMTLKTSNVKKKVKRVTKNVKRKIKEDMPLLPTHVNAEIEPIVNDENESPSMVLSVSSSLTKKQLSQVKEFIAQFGHPAQLIQWTCEGQVDYIDDATTHLIANDTGVFTTTLTKQVIQACVRHVFISSIDWIVSSLAQSSLLDHFPFEILRDQQASSNSRGIKQCRFDHLPVFPSSHILSVQCHSGVKHLQMTREELLEIVELSGATLFDEHLSYESLIVLCDSKKEMQTTRAQTALKDQSEAIFYCKPGYLFDSIVRHEIQPMENYFW